MFSRFRRAALQGFPDFPHPSDSVRRNVCQQLWWSVEFHNRRRSEVSPSINSLFLFTLTDGSCLSVGHRLLQGSSKGPHIQKYQHPCVCVYFTSTFLMASSVSGSISDLPFSLLNFLRISLWTRESTFSNLRSFARSLPDMADFDYLKDLN